MVSTDFDSKQTEKLILTPDSTYKIVSFSKIRPGFGLGLVGFFGRASKQLNARRPFPNWGKEKTLSLCLDESPLNISMDIYHHLFGVKAPIGKMR